MKSPPPPPPPEPVFKLAAVEPSPVEPIAVDPEAEPVAEDAEEDPPDVPADGLVELPDVAAPPNRLVAARSAADRLFCPPLPPEAPADVLVDEDALELLPPDSDGIAAVVLEALLSAEKSRPRPDWLPRSWGAISEAKFSAPVTPVSRSVRSTMPVVTVAVRRGPFAAGPALDGAKRRYRCAAAAIVKASAAPASHHLPRDGRCGTRGGTSCGFRSDGDMDGAGDAAFALAGSCMLRCNRLPCLADYTYTVR
ncbi:MAG TPA: hypothetical protein VFA28_17535 [Bryobacteraceae bacterium]|nr:hypothetical protein [Bryobacteraceae bacterium]